MLYTSSMAIKKQSGDSEKIILEVNNGDYQALQDLVNEWKFADESSALRFALAVLVQAKNKTVFIDDDSGKKTALSPGESLLKKEE